MVLQSQIPQISDLVYPDCLDEAMGISGRPIPLPRGVSQHRFESDPHSQGTLVS